MDDAADRESNRDIVEERMKRLLERKTAATRINKLAKVIVDQSTQI
jgi:hypothetical protein